MNRLLAIGDIHGEYDKLKQVLDKANYNENNDKLILIGDYIDRGNQSKKVIQLVKELVNTGAIALKGNHEDMAYNYIQKLQETKNNNRDIYFMNGGKKTLNCYSNTEQFVQDIEWLNKLPVKHVIEDEYIFVHAGLKPGVKLSEQKKKDILWIREQFFYYNWEKDKNINETIIAGHTPVKEVQFLPQVIMLDTGAGKGGYLSLIDLTNNKIYKSDL